MSKDRTLKILLTGATGFLGSHLLHALVENGCRVTILKRSFSDTWRINDCLDKVRSYDIDVVPLEKPFEEGGQFDSVVHTAVDYGRSDDAAIDTFETNLELPLRLIQTAASFNTASFLNTSTFFKSASTLYQYLSCYILSKRQFEDWGKIYANQGKIRLEWFYPSGREISKFLPSRARDIHSFLE